MLPQILPASQRMALTTKMNRHSQPADRGFHPSNRLPPLRIRDRLQVPAEKQPDLRLVAAGYATEDIARSRGE